MPESPLKRIARLVREGRFAAVENAARRLHDQLAGQAEFWHLLGVARLLGGRAAAAAEALARAVQLAPRSAETVGLLALAHSRLAHYAQAATLFEQSLALDSGRYDTLVNAAANANAARDPAGARRLAQRALAVNPNGVEAMTNLGTAAADAGDMKGALALYLKAEALGAASPTLQLSLANALVSAGRADEAEQRLQRLVSANPRDAAAQLDLGRALYQLGEIPQALQHFRAASDLDAALLDAHSAYLFCLAHDPSRFPEQVYAEHVRIGDLIEAPHRLSWPAHDNDRDPDRPLRVGWVSGDLCDHPVANLIEPLWESMKGGRCAIFAYYNGVAEDEVSRRLQRLADSWCRITALDDAAACARIRADGIDILVDLAGHTARNRLGVFARKPAPVQATMIGYPGTTGLAGMDYRFARAGTAAGEQPDEAVFREKLVFLRRRGFRFGSDMPDVTELPALAGGHLTFGSFNRPSKLAPPVIAVWCRIMRQLPGSELLLMAADEARIRARLASQFEALGIAAPRLRFLPRLPMGEFLAAHGQVDIALDPFPYSGGTTTLHALSMGVPVVTLAGTEMRQNQSATTLRLCGLEDWIARTEDDYVELAVRRAADLDGLAALRRTLRARIDASMRQDETDARAELEEVFGTIWRRWCAGEPPVSFTTRP